MFELLFLPSQHFPDLKNLTLTIETWPDQPNDDPKDMLSKILPHVQGLKSLYLTLMPGEIYIYDLLTLLSDVAKLSELEELSLDLFNFFIEYPELFLNKLPTCCPKLRVLKLSKYIKTSYISSLYKKNISLTGCTFSSGLYRHQGGVSAENCLTS